MTPRQAFRTLYPDARGPYTVRCTECGHTAAGDSPEIPVVCVPCLSRFRRGVIAESAAVCLCCAVDSGAPVETWKPIDGVTHPDGFTCADCGKVWTPRS